MSTAVHTVRRGETLSSIAKNYSCTVNQLASNNNIENKNVLSVGQILKIPDTRSRQIPDAELPKQNDKPKPVSASEKSILEEVGTAVIKGEQITQGLLDELLQRFRIIEANESVQKIDNVPIPESKKPVTLPPHQPPQKKNSKGSQRASDVKEKIKEALNREPHQVTLNGVKLTDNERKQIMASVAVCEMNADGFGSMNSDQEFVGRSKKFKSKGIETSYSRIVHIGLSYGVIQYTQDGGELGNVLLKMKDKNPVKFKEIFGLGDENVSNSLIVLTTTGAPDVANNPDVPISGLSYWSKIKNKQEGKDLIKLANEDKNNDGSPDLPSTKEIRGKRVQPLAPTVGGSAIDIWKSPWRERFLAAGNVADFQEAQIDYAVKRYLLPVLKVAKDNNVRSAIGLSFMAACCVRGAKIRLLLDVAQEKKFSIPFENSDNEKASVEAISTAGHSVGNARLFAVGETTFASDESRRAKELLKDELGFLAEDLYDISTY